MPTTSAVPSADPSDLLFNAQKLDEVINGTSESFVDRRGVERLTLTGALRLIGFEAPVAFTTGLSITRSTQTVTNGGNTYHADPASLPFTTTGTFNGAQWRLVSNVTQADLTTYAIPRAGASDLSASFKTTGTWETTGFKLDANALWSLASSNPTWQADTDDTFVYNRTSNKWSMVVGGTERFYVTATDGPARGTDAATNDGLPRKSQVEAIVADAVSTRMQYIQTASQSTTSGTAKDFEDVPSWVKKITVSMVNVSCAGGGYVGVQLGTGESPSYVTSGYAGCAWQGANFTNFTNIIAASSHNGAGDVRHGWVVLIRHADNTWQATSTVSTSNAASVGGGAFSITLPAELTAVRFTTHSGDTFDGGSVSVLFEG